MSTLNVAKVYKVLPAKHGVLVAFRDGSYSLDGNTTFVRVLAKRAHPVFGASVLLPEVGEQGIVAELDGGMLVWLGSLHYQDGNQIDPTVGLELDIHTSGVVRQTGENGDFEVLHPSGFRMTVSQDGYAMSAPAKTSSGPTPLAAPPYAVLSHPAGGELSIDPDGNLALAGFASLALSLPNSSSLNVDSSGNLSLAGFQSMTFTLAGGGAVKVDSDGNLTFSEFKSTAFQNGTNRFVMDTILNWLTSHTHSNGNNGAATGAPVQASALTPSSVCSPAKFTGPQGV